jgi:hypothetical protein
MISGQIEIRQSRQVAREFSPRQTVEEILKYISDGPSSDSRRERAEFIGVSLEDIKGVPTLELRQLPVSYKHFSPDEREQACQCAFEIGGFVEEVTEEDDKENLTHVGWEVLRWETLEEVKTRVLDKDYKKEVKEAAAKLQEQFKGVLALENFEVDLSSLTINNCTLICDENGILGIERTARPPSLASSESNLTRLKGRNES